MDTTTATSKRGTLHLWLISNLIVVLVLFALYEVALALLLRFPPPFEPVLRVLSGYYTEHDRHIVQALPECAVYDPKLAYTLKPGSCRFHNRDFDTEIRVNSKGLRDAEDRLLAPVAIALGDSVTMGWGVNIGETFPKLLERDCGIEVLNAGISSYGTVREMRMLQRLDLSRLKTLLIQYSDNDVGENRRFFDNGNAMKVMDAAEFREMQSNHAQRTQYLFGAHAVRFTSFFVGKISERLAAPPTLSERTASTGATESPAATHVRYFLNAVLNAGAIPPDVDILVYEINGRAKNNSTFAQALRRLLDQQQTSERVRQIRVLDLSPGLTNEKFFVLDDHPNASGHRYIADTLRETLQCRRR